MPEDIDNEEEVRKFYCKWVTGSNQMYMQLNLCVAQNKLGNVLSIFQVKIRNESTKGWKMPLKLLPNSWKCNLSLCFVSSSVDLQITSASLGPSGSHKDNPVFMYLAKENSHVLGSGTAVKACWRTHYRGHAFCHTHMSSSLNCGPNFTLLAAVRDGKHFHQWNAAFPGAWRPWHGHIFLNCPFCPAATGFPHNPQHLIWEREGQGLISSLPFSILNTSVHF